jgi:hypothetical protein
MLSQAFQYSNGGRWDKRAVRPALLVAALLLGCGGENPSEPQSILYTHELRVDTTIVRRPGRDSTATIIVKTRTWAARDSTPKPKR